MADFTIKPMPPSTGVGIGFWEDLRRDLVTASEIFAQNTRGADPSSDSSSGADIEYDPDTATVTEFITGIDAVLASISEVL